MIVRHHRGEYNVEPIAFQEAVDRLPDDAYVITDSNVSRFWGTRVSRPTLVVQAGEGSKSMETYARALEWLAESGARRGSTVVALGGGVVGDLAGFVAATYMRGIGLIQIPTSLLAMVDSSVGGKVAIDLARGKNLVGAFYPPHSVPLCLECLGTLPDEQFNNGCAEVWKYGAILDWSLFEQLEEAPLRAHDGRLREIVETCIRLKAQIVEQDEFETTGLRAVLNFGHTIGHALETLSGYALLHGEAVAIGMVAESRIGQRLGITPKGLAKRLEYGLASQGLPTKIGDVDPRAIVDAMRLDKKAGPEGLGFALLTGYGSCKLNPSVSEAIVLECLQESL